MSLIREHGLDTVIVPSPRVWIGHSQLSLIRGYGLRHSQLSLVREYGLRHSHSSLVREYGLGIIIRH